MKQKILGFLAAVIVASVGLTVVAPAPAEAKLGGQNCGVDGFLGLRPWYYGLCNSNSKGNSQVQEPENEEDMKAFVWTIILNILLDLLVIAGYASMIFIIYGGYQFIMSQGDPGKTASGKKTLTSAIVGLVVTLSASVLVNTGRVILGISNAGGSISDLPGKGLTPEQQQAQIQSAFTWAYTVAGLVAVAFIVYGGIKYVISQGDPGKTRAATQSIIYAVVGLVVVLMAAAITALVTSSVSGTNFN